MFGYISCIFILGWISTVYLKDNKKFKSIKTSMKIEKEDEIELKSVAYKHFGLSGKSITMDPKSYRATYPEKTFVFKGNIVTKNGTLLWFGDLNITDEEEKLMNLSNEIGTTIYVLEPNNNNMSEYIFMTNGKKINYNDSKK